MVRALHLKQSQYMELKIFSRGSVDNNYKHTNNGFVALFKF